MSLRMLLLLGLSIINSSLAMDEQMMALIARYQQESDLFNDEGVQISLLTVHHPQQDQKMELLKLGNAYYVRKKELISVGNERIPWSATIALPQGPKEEDCAFAYHVLKLLKHRRLRELNNLPEVALRQLTTHESAVVQEPEMKATLDAPLAEQKDEVDEQLQARIELQQGKNWKFYTAGAASGIGFFLGVVLTQMLHKYECTE